MSQSAVIVLFLCSTLALAQRYPLDVTRVPEGPVVAMAQDRDGFLWAGGPVLYRFDGVRLVAIPVIENVVDLAAASDGSMWVAAKGGIFRVYELRAERKLATPADRLLFHGDSLYFLASAEGDQDRDILRIPLRLIGKQQQAAVQVGKGYGSLQFDNEGHLWFPCGEGICQLQGVETSAPRLVTIGASSGLPAMRWNHVAADLRGAIWASSAGQKAFVIRRGALRFQEIDPRVGNVLSARFTGNQVWFTGDNGVFWDRDGQPDFIRAAALHVDSRGFGAFLDRDENIWLSVPGGFARWIGNRNIAIWEEQDGLPMAFEIAESSGGILFAGGTKGLFRASSGGTHWTHVPGTKMARSITRVRWGSPQFMLFSKGDLELFEFDVLSEKWAPARVHIVPQGTPATDAIITKTGAALVGGRSNGSWPAIDLHFPQDIRMLDAKTDAQGRLWIVSRTGLWVRFPSGEWRGFTTADGMLQTSTQAIQLAPDGSIWIGYDSPVGISRLRAEGKSAAQLLLKWTHYPNRVPSRAESTLSLGFDTTGKLWRGTADGIVISDGEHLSSADDTIRLTDRDGLPSTDTNIFGFHRSGQGEIWIGTTLGAALFRAPWAVAVPNRPVFAGISSLQDLKAELVVLSYAEAHKVRLEYRILPGDGSWKIAEKNSVNLASLAPGNYRLETRAHPTRWFQPANIAARNFTVPGIPLWTWLLTGLVAIVLPVGIVTLHRRRTKQAQEDYEEHKQNFLTRDPAVAVMPSEVASPAVLEPGAELLGKYHIEGLVARGGFSDVYGAIALKTGEKVAVKRLRTPEIAGRLDSGWMRRRLAQEVAAVSMVKHRGVLPVLDSWIDADGNPTLVLPFVEGPTLRKHLLGGGHLDRQLAVAILREVASIVTAAHGKGVIHCDLKPENIMLAGSELRPIVIDFGTSALHLQATALSEHSRPAGTLQYMAPEQLLGRYSPATDVYAFALLSLELLTGVRYSDLRVPFDDNWEQHLGRALGDLGMTVKAAELFAGALQFDPLKREQNIESWAGRLFASLTENHDDTLQ